MRGAAGSWDATVWRPGGTEHSQFGGVGRAIGRSSRMQRFQHVRDGLPCEGECVESDQRVRPEPSHGVEAACRPGGARAQAVQWAMATPGGSAALSLTERKQACLLPGCRAQAVRLGRKSSGPPEPTRPVPGASRSKGRDPCQGLCAPRVVQHQVSGCQGAGKKRKCWSTFPHGL